MQHFCAACLLKDVTKSNHSDCSSVCPHQDLPDRPIDCDMSHESVPRMHTIEGELGLYSKVQSRITQFYKMYNNIIINDVTGNFTK